MLRYRLMTWSMTYESSLLDANSTEQFEIGQHLACTQDYAGQRLFGNADGQAGILADSPVEVLQQRAAAGKNDALIADVGAQFGGRAFQCDADRIQNRSHAFRDRFPDFAVVHGDGF